uniref:Protein kinase domain-containing protein n=1 Tax=Acrobeloides nanus TaxID=290746 RepID=A0A914DD65_9BILA
MFEGYRPVSCMSASDQEVYNPTTQVWVTQVPNLGLGSSTCTNPSELNNKKIHEQKNFLGINFDIPNDYEIEDILSNSWKGVMLKIKKRNTEEKVSLFRINDQFAQSLQIKIMYRNYSFLKKVEHENFVMLAKGIKPYVVEGFNHVYLAIEYMDYPLRALIDQKYKLTDITYRAPEMIFDTSPYDEKIDIWSVVCIFVELLTGKTLYQISSSSLITKESLDRGREEVMNHFENSFISKKATEYYSRILYLSPIQILQDDLQSTSKESDYSAEIARDLLSKMLKIKPEDRISSGDALQHKYINSTKFNSSYQIDELAADPLSISEWQGMLEFI